jgi:hypothetical protein
LLVFVFVFLWSRVFASSRNPLTRLLCRQKVFAKNTPPSGSDPKSLSVIKQAIQQCTQNGRVPSGVMSDTLDRKTTYDKRSERREINGYTAHSTKSLRGSLRNIVE